MTEDWLHRWAEGRTGWHEAGGNAALQEHWPKMPAGSRILVPLCGKSPDLLWLAHRGGDVTGVELSPIACEAFFAEQRIDYETRASGGFCCFEAVGTPLRIFCGDYFNFRADPFDALFDRGSLVAFPADSRAAYAAHTRSLVKNVAYQLVLTLEYDQSAVDGPPWSVAAAEINDYWPHLHVVSRRNDIDNGPPKFRKAGLTEFTEVVWAGNCG